MKAACLVRFYLHGKVIWPLLVPNLKTRKVQPLKSVAVSLPEVLGNREHVLFLINGKPSNTGLPTSGVSLCPANSCDRWDLCFHVVVPSLHSIHRAKSQNLHRTNYLSSCVLWIVKPDTRYFLRMFPRWVTSTLIPLNAFFIYKEQGAGIPSGITHGFLSKTIWNLVQQACSYLHTIHIS